MCIYAHVRDKKCWKTCYGSSKHSCNQYWDGIYTSKKAGRKRKRRITTRTRRKEEEKEQEVEPYINQEQEGKEQEK